MVSPTRHSTFRRLFRLAVTVSLNLAFSIAVIGWGLGQFHRYEVHRSTTADWLSGGLDDTGWAVWFLPQYGTVAGYRFWMLENDPQWWEIPDNHEGTFDFAGGFHKRVPDLIAVAVKHWLVISVLLSLQAIHHRRLISKLIFRRGKTK